MLSLLKILTENSACHRERVGRSVGDGSFGTETLSNYSTSAAFIKKNFLMLPWC
jgi:hypothetical protein